MAELKLEYLKRLTPERRAQLLERSKTDVTEVLEDVRRILMDLRRDGDQESLRWHRQYKADLAVNDLEVSDVEIEAAHRALDPKVLEALKAAAINIDKFHQAQREREMHALEVAPGILAGRLIRPLERVGCYIPGGLASYPSSALMNVIPARVAGVKEIVACTPPGPEMALNPATVAAA
jgi:histidinol dehydrogenase